MTEEKITETKKDIKPAIDGSDVVVRKKSTGRKSVESFLGEEIESVKDHIVYDMIIPSTKDAMSNMCGGIVDFFNDMFHSFIDSIFFGSDNSRTKSKGSETYVSYSGYYNKKNTSSNQSRRESHISTRYNLEDLEYPNMEKALKVRKDLIELIENYNEASVADLFYLSEQTLDWADYKEKDKFGWTDPLSIGKPRRRRGKYIIPLPRPEKLRED